MIPPRPAAIAPRTVPAIRLAALCAGHFPGEPIVPGALLIGLMLEGLPRPLPRPLRVRRCAFRAPVGPDAAATVEQALRGEEWRIRLYTPAGLAAEARVDRAAPGPEAPWPTDPLPTAPSSDPPPLRHRPPALVIAAPSHLGPAGASAPTRPGPWPWTRLVDGAAQLVGVAAAARRGVEPGGGLVAELLDLIVDPFADPLATARIEVRFEREIIGLDRYAFAARAPSGEVVARGRITLALALPEAR